MDFISLFLYIWPVQVMYLIAMIFIAIKQAKHLSQTRDVPSGEEWAAYVRKRWLGLPHLIILPITILVGMVLIGTPFALLMAITYILGRIIYFVAGLLWFNSGKLSSRA
jgi:hypothetical protein